MAKPVSWVKVTAALEIDVFVIEVGGTVEMEDP
jgi:hypothetical protein